MREVTIEAVIMPTKKHRLPNGIAATDSNGPPSKGLAASSCQSGCPEESNRLLT